MLIEVREGSARGASTDAKFPAAWKKYKHHLSFDHDAMMTEQNPKQEAAPKRQSLSTSGHFFLSQNLKMLAVIPETH